MCYAFQTETLQVIDQHNLKSHDLTYAKRIGFISTKIGNLDVYEQFSDDGSEVIYGALDPKSGSKKSVSFIGFSIGGKNILYARNAYTLKKYQKKGIASELFLFINKMLGKKIISDAILSSSGESLWQSLIRSPNISSKILYLPTGEMFDLSDIGSSTNDGTKVISPKDDNTSPDFYNAANGTRFFYILEVNDIIKISKKGKLYEYSISKQRNLGSSFLQGIRWLQDCED